jgi:hypothetical protein
MAFGLWRLNAPLSYDLLMPLNLPLNEMTFEEKLQAMEALWDDLSRKPDILESPAWHEDILRERQQQLAAGEASFMDWEQAKAYIRNRAS